MQDIWLRIRDTFLTAQENIITEFKGEATGRSPGCAKHRLMWLGLVGNAVSICSGLQQICCPGPNVCPRQHEPTFFWFSLASDCITACRYHLELSGPMFRYNPLLVRAPNSGRRYSPTQRGNPRPESAMHPTPALQHTSACPAVVEAFALRRPNIPHQKADGRKRDEARGSLSRGTICA